MNSNTKNSLTHSNEGTKWKHHKYLRIENGRYIYPDQMPSSAKKSAQQQLMKDRLKGSNYMPFVDKEASEGWTPHTYDNTQERKYKYIAKVKISNGQFRYFYDKDALEKYYMENGTDAEKLCAKEFGLKETKCRSEGDQIEINENYEDGIEFQHNCANCSLAYDMRRKGFDVEAIPNKNGLTNRDVYSCYDNYEENLTKIKTGMHPKVAATKMINDMKKYGDGAYGILYLSWKGDGGHSLTWEVRNNRVIIRDSQISGAIYDQSQIYDLVRCTSIESNSIIDKIAPIPPIQYLRTDNLKFNSRITKYVRKNRSEKDANYVGKIKINPEKFN